MGVYIKGVEMPKNCGYCKFHRPFYHTQFCVILDKNCSSWKEQKAWCPLTEVPEPHGRLIDADALADDLETDGKEFGDEMKLNCASWLRSNATLTVIERSDYE